MVPSEGSIIMKPKCSKLDTASRQSDESLITPLIPGNEPQYFRHVSLVILKCLPLYPF